MKSEGDTRRAALADIARARGSMQLAKETGLRCPESRHAGHQRAPGELRHRPILQTIPR